MAETSSGALAPWRQRFEQARADLLDGRHVLDLRTQLAKHTDEPVVLSDRVALGRARRVGVFAGSFNPQTVAHAAVAEAARAAAHLDALLWALARVTVDKERVERAMLADRMVQLVAYCRATVPGDAVIALDPGLYADQAEVVRGLLAPDAELWLIVGYDKVVQILDPRYYADRDAALRRLFAAAGLLVAPRAGQGADELRALLSRAENQPFAAGIRVLPVPGTLAEIASTAARRLLAGARAPDGAAEYEALARTLTPEGAALGLATGAYEVARPVPDGTLVDRYGARLAWLDALAGSA
ncbi:MAG TPA: hypothetical protein VIG30_01435 [Ktedonobacterales bacterium]|jgi:nicotinic acid mononucleotide adenylyltransferase